jgi:hypothetical protein
VYDMYPWHSAGPGGRPPQTPPRGHGPGGRPPQTPPAGAINAVQVALDRRDNGGDAAAAPGTPAAGPTRQ